MNKPENLDEAIQKCEQEIVMHQNCINQLHADIAALIRAGREGVDLPLANDFKAETSAERDGTIKDKQEVIRQYVDLVSFRIAQISTDFTEAAPLEGYEAEWDHAKKTIRVLTDIYKRLETDRFSPEPEDKEKLYDIIANVLESDIAVHVNQTGTCRYEVMLFAVPDGKIRHGISIVLEGRGPVKKVISHSFF